jgi:hypothetical protein
MTTLYSRELPTMLRAADVAAYLNPSSPEHFSNKVLCINMLEEKFGLLLVATFW